MIKAGYHKFVLDFKRPSGTSRGTLTQKETWFLKLEENGKVGYGECSVLRGLSVDDLPDYEEKLKWLCRNINTGKEVLYEKLRAYPSIQFGLETALFSLRSLNPFELFPSGFTKGQKKIQINGLIWMGRESFMKKQIDEKLNQGFSCIKLKIGAIDFEKELELLSFIRKRYSANQVELRVDANGAFTPAEAADKLKELSRFELHSIEQPIKPGQINKMSDLCASTPLPIALDEELIGIRHREQKRALLTSIKPQYIILKPALVGGFTGTREWIEEAEKQAIGWWITSALESNIGLNAIAQWTATLSTQMPQGLGTGSLYTNNLKSPLEVQGEWLTYNPELNWELPQFFS